MTTAIWAHRGDTRSAPENTLAAFEAARVAGADGVELDVRRCADGVLVVHHDAVVAGVGPIAATARRRLPASVPTLEEALEALAGMTVNVEVKSDPGEPGFDPAEPTARATGEVLAGRQGIVASSFSLAALEALGEAAPGLRRGWLTLAATEAALCEAARRGLAALHPFVAGVDEAAVAEARRLGLGLHVWTVNREDDLAAMGRLGVDAVITDRPALARRLLG